MKKTAKNLLNMLKNLQQEQLKLLRKEIQEIAEAMGDLIADKISYKITQVSKSSPQNIQKL